jgi:hypothetical protein
MVYRNKARTADDLKGYIRQDTAAIPAFTSQEYSPDWTIASSREWTPAATTISTSCDGIQLHKDRDMQVQLITRCINSDVITESLGSLAVDRTYVLRARPEINLHMRKTQYEILLYWHLYGVKG